jgi:hypothetical protein
MKRAMLRLRSLLPRGLALWGGLTVLLAVGVLTSLTDLAGTPAAETLRANSAHQRVIIDPVTGLVSGLPGNTAPTPAFEVSEEPNPSEETPATEAPESTAPADPEAPETTPAAEPDADTEATEPQADPTEDPAAEPAAEATTEPETVGSYSLRTSATAAAMPTVARSSQSLVRAPAPEITERKGKLSIPKKGDKDVTPRQLYAKTFQRVEQQPLIAFVVMDAGFSNESLNMILALPPEVSVGISPYADRSDEQIAALRNAGHEVWAMLPAMTDRYPQDDPGPLGLMNLLTPSEALDRLHRVLSNTVGSVGVILPANEALSQHAEMWQSVRHELVERGLFFLSANPTRDLEKLGGGEDEHALMRQADLMIDDQQTASAIRSKLASLAAKAEAKKKLVVLLRARPQSLELLQAWLKKEPLQAPTVLAPLSAIYAPDVAPPPPEAPEKSGGH